MRPEFIIKSPGPVDKKYLRNFLEFCDVDYEYPCKVIVIGPSTRAEFYVEVSNVGTGLIIMDWAKNVR